MTLWTTDILGSARQIYLDRGFQLIQEQPERQFGADLLSQTYATNL
ncbi:hypothetical protein LRQ04_16420 [Paenarthrobacter sp. AR 02]|nr:hypothetical protein [Paenarthrobacter sp. AR 02]MCF3140842.1 hypothetical protein [Paenarthrobacter sp. AR 02]